MSDFQLVDHELPKVWTLAKVLLDIHLVKPHARGVSTYQYTSPLGQPYFSNSGTILHIPVV